MWIGIWQANKTVWTEQHRYPILLFCLWGQLFEIAHHSPFVGEVSQKNVAKVCSFAEQGGKGSKVLTPSQRSKIGYNCPKLWKITPKKSDKFVLLIKVQNLAPFLLLVDFPYSFQTRSSPECLTENLAIVLQNVQTTKLEITKCFLIFNG